MEVPVNVSADCAREACWAVSNLASGDSAIALAVAEKSLPTLLKLFACPDATVREQAVWAVANIAGDGVEGRDAVLATTLQVSSDEVWSSLRVLLELLVSSEAFPSLLRTST